MPDGLDTLEAVVRNLDDTERGNVRRVAHDLGIEPTDALWSLLVALEHYRKLYGDIPDAIKQAVDATLGAVKKRAEEELKGTEARIAASLTKTVASTAQSVAAASANRSLTRWMAAGAVVASMILAVGFWAGWHFGSGSGFATGKLVALDIQSAASWAATEDGHSAYRLWQAGELGHLANCDRPGWQIRDSVCYPQQSRGRVYGWRLK